MISYNTRGFSINKEDVCRYLLQSHFGDNKLTLLCNQEHFLLKSNSYKINRTLPGYFVIVKPAVKNAHDKGRPKGGLFIAVPDIFKNEVNDVSPAFWRTQAITLKIGSSKILLINSYFPTDPGTVNFEENELIETLHSVREVIEENDFDQCVCVSTKHMGPWLPI